MLDRDIALVRVMILSTIWFLVLTSVMVVLSILFGYHAIPNSMSFVTFGVWLVGTLLMGIREIKILEEPNEWYVDVKISNSKNNKIIRRIVIPQILSKDDKKFTILLSDDELLQLNSKEYKKVLNMEELYIASQSSKN